MNLVPSPDPAGIPAPAWIFEFLLLFTQTVHAAFMNYVLGGSWFLLWLHFGRGIRWKDLLYQRCLAFLPVALSMTITFGVAPLLFVQVLYGRFFYTANVLMGGYWLSTLLILVACFYGIYVLKAKSQADGSEWLGNGFVRFSLHLLLALGFTAIAFLLTANAVLTVSPGVWEGAYLGSPIRTVVLEVPFFWPRFVHNVIGAWVVAGVWIVWIANHGGDKELKKGAIAGAVFGLLSTGPQMIVGVWYILSLPEPVMRSLFDLKSLASTHLLSGLVVAALLFFCLTFLIALPQNRKLRWGAAISAVTVLMAMITASEGIRRVLLADHWSDLVVRSQPGPMVIFWLLLGAGSAVLAWILRVVWISNRP